MDCHNAPRIRAKGNPGLHLETGAVVSRFSRITRVAVTGSTNDDMARMLGEEHARGLTLVADYQERGSGRKGRSWLAAPGSALLCTIALPDPLPAAHLWAVPFWSACIVRDALEACGVSGTRLQWPNDVLSADGRKIAGILCISRVAGEYAWAGCGIGVNVRRPQDAALYEEIVPPPAFATDFADVDRDTLLEALLRAADTQYSLLETPPAIVQHWEPLANVPGQPYRILKDGETQPFDAAALRLLPGGSLLVQSGDEQREISLADARALR